MALSKEEILQAIEEMKVIELHELVEAITSRRCSSSSRRRKK